MRSNLKYWLDKFLIITCVLSLIDILVSSPYQYMGYPINVIAFVVSLIMRDLFNFGCKCGFFKKESGI